MTRQHLMVVCVFLLGLMGLAGGIAAQDGAPTPEATPDPNTVSPFGVYVTTQDFLALRMGPGAAFSRIKVVPPAVTAPAVGRSPDGKWMQIVYEGGRGWVSSRYLVWTGNVTSLTVSTMQEQVRVVRTGAIGFVEAGTQFYDSRYLPTTTASVSSEVELIGRLGSGAYIWLQVDYLGTPHWVRSWEINYDSEYVYTLDAAVQYVYTRLARQMSNDFDAVSGTLSTIEGIWLRLASGGQVSCGVIPEFARRQARDADIATELVFAPVADSLDEAILDVNAAIVAFEEACNRPEDQFYLLPQEVVAALNDLNSARRNLVLAGAIAVSLERRDPIVINSRGG